MANLEQFGKFLRPLSHYLKKMELELTCPSCSVMLRQPKLLPCTHVVCSQCVVAKNVDEYECPVCVATCPCVDLRPIMLIEKMIDIFKSLDNAIASSVQKLCPQRLADHNNIDGNIHGSEVGKSSSKMPLIESTLSGQNNTKEKLDDIKFDMPGMMTEFPPKASPLSSNTKEREKEELVSNVFGGQRNNLQSHPPLPGFVTRRMPGDGGESDELTTFDSKTCTHNAKKDTDIDPEQPATPSSLHDFKERKTNDDQRSGHGCEKAYVDGLSIKNAEEAGTCAETQKACLSQISRKSNDAKSHTSVSSSETDDDDAREVKRQKLQNEQGSDCNDMPCCASEHVYAKETVKCAFCHFSKITEFTGPMVHYVNGRPVKPEEVNQSNVKNFHEKCIEWAPQAFFDGEIAKNLEDELVRASKINCCECGRKGAALGCYIESCWRSYHLPCAVEQEGCRWDCENFILLCPCHSSCKFPNEIVHLKWTIKAKRSSLLRDKSRTRQKAKCSSAQTEHSKLRGQHTSTPEESCDEFWGAEPGVCRQWVLCGSDLSTSDMALINKFASLSGASVTGKWNPNVTHLIASTNESGACNRTQKVLMAILNGKWVLTIDWVKASMAAKSPVSEDAFEIGQDCYGIADGPKKGRIRAIQKAVKIFSGLSFYFTNQFEPPYRGFLEEVVLAAGGTVLKSVDLVIDATNVKVFSVGSAFIVYNEDPPPMCTSAADLEEVVMKRCDEVGALESKTGFKVIGHMLLLDHIAASSSASELVSSLKTSNV